MNKKGQSLRDTFFILAFILLAGIAFLFLGYINTEMQTSFLANSALNQSNATVTVLTDGINTVNSRMDYMIFIILIGFTLAMIISGYFIPVESIFFVIYVIGTIFGLLSSIIIQYLWEQFSTITFLSTRLAAMPITNHILNNIGIYYTIIAGIALIVTYAKPGADR